MASVKTEHNGFLKFKTPIIWKHVFSVGMVHVLGMYGFFLLPTAKILNLAWVIFMTVVGISGASAGPHRLWTHKTYKAKLPMRILAMLCFIISGQYSIVQWVRDHRTHHKFTDTDADPHSAERGLFYSHVGWFLLRRHPELLEKGKVIDVSDVWQDPVVRFQQKYFKLLILLVHMLFPSAVAYYIFGESLKNCVFITYFLRYMISLNVVWTINSLGHYIGHKPYNKKIRATDHPLLAFLVMGEGWHNFHHTFPWDYRIGTFGQKFQLTARVIEWFARRGLAYDLKLASPELIQKVLAKQDLPLNYEVPEKGFDEKVDGG